MVRTVLSGVLLAVATTLSAIMPAAAQKEAPKGLGQIETIVVIYAENRSFDNLYGHFQGADRIQNLTPEAARQRDRDGSILAELPPVWAGLTAPGVTPPITEAQPLHLPNRPFAIDDPQGFNTPIATATRDLWHLFWENQMQIDGGKNDMFAAWSNAGGLVMGHYASTPQTLPLWDIARRYTLADNFFMGALGGSFLNHFWLVCACTPVYPDAANSPAKGLIAVVTEDGAALKVAEDSPKSALGGVPKFVHDGQITPDFYAVNTMQPPYQPSQNKPAPGGDLVLANPNEPTTLPPQKIQTIGDLLSESKKEISWAWYAGAWQATLDGPNFFPSPNF